MLCSGTLKQASLRDKVEAASRCGYQAISLWIEDVERAAAEGLDARDVRALIADRGLEVAELDPFLGWLGSGTPGGSAARGADAMLGRKEEEFYAVAETIGGTALNCAHPFPGEVDFDQAAESFAGVCDRARERGLSVLVEFLPWTAIADVSSAAEIVARAGRANGGIMLDTWHYFRGSSTAEQLRETPGGYIKGVQINNAPAKAQGNPMVESMNARLLPDEGAIDVPEILRILQTIEAPAPIGVEVFSNDLDALSSTEAARRCADSARAVIASATQESAKNP